MTNTEIEQAIGVTVSVWLPAGVRCASPAGDAAVPLKETPRSAHRTDRGFYDRGFEDGAAAGCALGRHLEALRWAEEMERWRRLVRWAAAQRDAT